MRIVRIALPFILIVALGMMLVSGGSDSDPRTPPALPGLPPPFLGTAVTGEGQLTAAVDAYGDVVDLRAGPTGAPLIDNPSDRQAAGTVPEDTGIVPRVSRTPMWAASSVSQRFLSGTNVLRTVARVGAVRAVMTTAAAGDSLAVVIRTGPEATPSLTVDVAGEVRCARERRAGQLDLICRVGRAVPSVSGGAAGDAAARACAQVIRAAADGSRAWVDRSRPLGAHAPTWARAMYRRSLLTIHALTSRVTGAVAAGARDGWAYVWPRDAATAVLALEASGHHAEARHVARFLTELELPAAARFTGSGTPVPGRAAQGDAAGWVTVAARATGVAAPRAPYPWRDRADYRESSRGSYLGNALAAAGEAESARIARAFGTPEGLVRVAADPGSGLDSAAGWAVRPFDLTPLYPAAERTLLHLTHDATAYGITPGEDWAGGNDPWTAPTAWSAWALAALATDRGTGGRRPRTDLPAVRERGRPSRPSLRHAALALLADLRRASTPAGGLPERVGVHTGAPTSTTPLLWSSAFVVLALRELWP